jgi:hypothetical protein
MEKRGKKHIIHFANNTKRLNNKRWREKWPLSISESRFYGGTLLRKDGIHLRHYTTRMVSKNECTRTQSKTSKWQY